MEAATMNRPQIDDDAWAALLERDASRDGEFVFAVVTTGIYCRPSCPARRPLRRNVMRFATGAEARAEGFRPCLRCRPDEVADELVERALAHLDEHVDDGTTLARVAEAAGASPFHLQRRFKERVGLTPREYLAAVRLARFRAEVRETGDVSSAGYGAGFGSSRGLYAAAATGLGMTPRQYARRGAEIDIAYTTRRCALGAVLVASSERGVCAVLLGDDDEALEGELRREFDRARLTRSDTTRREWADAVVRHLDDTRTPLAVPLDARGTPFQVRVWRELRRIPPGRTLSYAEVAAAIGSPRAVRAVGTACGQNTIAVLVPCHRVVRKDGGLGGWRWGERRKRELLEREARAPSS